MLGFSLGVDAPEQRNRPSPPPWPQGVAAALDFRRDIYALPDVADVGSATAPELSRLRLVQFSDAISMSRASAATYVDAAGMIHTAAVDEPRFDWSHGKRQLLSERDAINLFVNPFSPATQDVAVTAGDDYVVHVSGSGSIALSGAATGVATHGSPVYFTAGEPSLTCTVSGALDATQVESIYGGNVLTDRGTSFVDGVRARDKHAFSQPIVDLFNRPEFTMLVQYGHVLDTDSSVKRLVRQSGAKFIGWRGTDGNLRNTIPNTSLGLTTNATLEAPKAVAAAWSPTDRAIAGWNGSASVNSGPADARDPASVLELAFNGGGRYQPSLWIDAVYMWPRRLSDAEMLSVTAPYAD